MPPPDHPEARAARALRGAGLDPRTPLTPAPSNANEAWLADGFVLRVNYRGDIGRLAREASLAARLTADTLYPGVLDHGDDGELEWLLVRRVPGIALGRAWPDLTPAQRRTATRQLAMALRALHRTDPEGLPGDGELDPPHTLPLEPLLALLAEVEPHLAPPLAEGLAALVRERWDAFDDANTGVVHGDPHLENVLWHEGSISAVIDLEWSRRSWVEVDLEILLAFCEHPAWFVSADYEDRALAAHYAEVPGGLRQAYPQWCEHPRREDRLAILRISRMLGLLHEFPPSRPRDPLHPRDRRNVLWAILEASS